MIGRRTFQYFAEDLTKSPVYALKRDFGTKRELETKEQTFSLIGLGFKLETGMMIVIFNPFEIRGKTIKPNISPFKFVAIRLLLCQPQRL